MFNKVLIANRGAVACRIERTLQRMGVASVAIYTRADAASLHVRQADEAVLIGAGPVADSYLSIERVLEAALSTKAQAIHPGYGFLAESAVFAEACAAQGLVFLGPTAAQIRTFGLKHTARAVATAQGVPLLPGTGVLEDLNAALAEAERIGYPVMLKSSAGGGGIGMRLARTAHELSEVYASVARLAEGHFDNPALFLERYLAAARHVEVQIFGDGQGEVIALGERDCSVQRRNQKVIEEAPAPGLSDATRIALSETACRLMRATQYQSAGTVEFLVDATNDAFYFLEVNTRLQVEHGVTEEVFGIDLVEWMVRLGAAQHQDFFAMVGRPAAPLGVAIQARIYAEDPARAFQPSTGVLTEVTFPAKTRIETWVEAGINISAYYDAMLAKLIVYAPHRAAATLALKNALRNCRISGIETNLAYLEQILADPRFEAGHQTTALLEDFRYQPRTVEVVQPGLQTTLQDWPGRIGYWDVGVPPSGPMDALAHRLANRLVGNPADTAVLECTLIGPVLRFRTPCVIALTGAVCDATLNGAPLAAWQAHAVSAGALLALGAFTGPGCRAYLAVAGGFDVPSYLGSRSTFMLGQFGGHAGRTLRSQDMLHLAGATTDEPFKPAFETIPSYRNDWHIAVLYGPHGAPDFFTDDSIEEFFATDWQVHFQSSRTGVRLIGPKPRWARQDGGEAGLHPSNIHDNAYAVGAIDFTGDMPVILGPDGPSLGGFVCPAVIIDADLWKIGQLRAGDRVRFHRVSLAEAAKRRRALDDLIEGSFEPLTEPVDDPHAVLTPVLARRDADELTPQVLYRQSGDCWLLIEYGPLVLDLALSMRAHALMAALRRVAAAGIIDLTPGIRSLQIHFEPRRLPRDELLAILARLEDELPDVEHLEVESRIVHLPLAWDDSSTQEAIQRYMRGVRSDAPWCPSNIEFIRRINGLASIEAVRDLFFSASYLVLGLGDVYLGAPVATPVDPRHRLVTTKYNPARTWTPENAVGIGGAYLCVYGMEGPGGYQFVGRTIQMWNRWRFGTPSAAPFDKPWLLRLFDQLRFYPVSEVELDQLRQDFPLGRARVRIEPTTFRLADYRALLAREADGIARFKATQQAAFEAERDRWHAAGLLDREESPVSAVVQSESLPPGVEAVGAPLQGLVAKVLVSSGDSVAKGSVLAVVESMKMEFFIHAPCAAVVWRLACQPGQEVEAGQDIVLLQQVKAAADA